MYARTVGGRVLTFGVSGKLLRNALVMYDRETESDWSQLLGEAVAGPLVGARLAWVPSTMMTWGAWRAQFPDTKALRKPGPANDPYLDYYRSGDAGVLGEAVRDERLKTKDFVLGVRSGERAKAYPFRVLDVQPVVNDTLGGEPIAVFFDPKTGMARAWRRVVDGRALTFEPLAGGVDVRVRDRETGTVWSAAGGRALEGPLAGKRLEDVVATVSFWFGWKDFYPHTEVYGS